MTYFQKNTNRSRTKQSKSKSNKSTITKPLNTNYKRYISEHNIKGIYICWPNRTTNPGYIFPQYRNVSGSHVSQKRISKLIPIIVLVLEQEQKRINQAFEQLLKKKYKNKGMQLKINFKRAIARALNTKVMSDSEALYGESDIDGIWIAGSQMSDEQLLGTILHESLHFVATSNGKEICEKDEHFAMRLLGDDCCYKNHR